MKPASYLLSRVYLYATGVRNFLYDRRIAGIYKSSIPVISIGNITAGGNGKTPLCLWLCRELMKRGHRPVVLSRGYGGSDPGPTLVKPSDGASKVGDEPLLMARTGDAPVVICRRRIEGAQYIEREGLGDLIILDDGFQHRALHRSVDLVCVDVSSDSSVSEFTAGRMLPVGRLRETRDRALARASIVVCVARKIEEWSAIDRRVSIVKGVLPSTLPVYISQVILDSVTSLADGARLPPSSVVAAFCGIAHPEAFRGTLESSGFTVQYWKSFEDHHVFSDGDLAELRLNAGHLPLVCTAKDGVKIPEHARNGLFATEISSHIEGGDDLVARILSTCSVQAPA